MKKKAASRKKKSPAKKAIARKTPKKKASPRKSTSASSRKKKTNPRAGKRPSPPSSRPQPVPLAGGQDEHGPMHIPSHKPVPAYAQMHQNDWAGKPPTHNIPIPKH